MTRAVPEKHIINFFGLINVKYLEPGIPVEKVVFKLLQQNISIFFK